MSYFYNNVPITPGAYLVNTGGNDSVNHLPIFSSISNLYKMGYANSTTGVDNIYYVLPGYKIELYSSIDYGGTHSQTIDSSGTKIMYVLATTQDSCESIKMYYNNVYITEKYTYTSYSSNSGTPTTPTLTSTIGPYNISNFSLFPGAYTINSTGGGCMPIFFSITNFSAFLDDTGDHEDVVLVMPGYRLILYFAPDYANTEHYVDINNTTGTTIIVGQSNTTGTGWNNNNVSSCRLFFNGNEFTRADLVS